MTIEYCSCTKEKVNINFPQLRFHKCVESRIQDTQMYKLTGENGKIWIAAYYNEESV